MGPWASTPPCTPFPLKLQDYTSGGLPRPNSMFLSILDSLTHKARSEGDMQPWVQNNERPSPVLCATQASGPQGPALQRGPAALGCTDHFQVNMAVVALPQWVGSRFSVQGKNGLFRSQVWGPQPLAPLQICLAFGLTSKGLLLCGKSWRQIL